MHIAALIARIDNHQSLSQSVTYVGVELPWQLQKCLKSEVLSFLADNVRQMRDGKQCQSPLILRNEIVSPSSSLGQHQMSQQRECLCELAPLIAFKRSLRKHYFVLIPNMIFSPVRTVNVEKRPYIYHAKKKFLVKRNYLNLRYEETDDDEDDRPKS